MSDAPSVPNERWTVEVDFPDRESAFAAARRWADEREDTTVAWRWPTFYDPTGVLGDGNEREGWIVKPGTASVADVIAGRADIPTKFVQLARLPPVGGTGRILVRPVRRLWSRSAEVCREGCPSSGGR